jgi:hypothetical protein
LKCRYHFFISRWKDNRRARNARKSGRCGLRTRLSPPVKCRPTLQGADAGDTTTIVETAIATAEQIEDAQADATEPQTLDEIIADKGITAIRPWLTSTPSASAHTLQSATGVVATGQGRPRPRRRCMGIVAGFVDHADGV